ncbi:HNH endonuclease [Lachnospira sp.]|uniref:HNH endonuclease n=1 Tax=Lachnospira sp. TaxID=2049031 RepID=UPI003FA5EF85
MCGISEWLGNPITIQLHHINGDREDNRLENLIMLCPNCHSQTHNFCKRKSLINKKECSDGNV